MRDRTKYEKNGPIRLNFEPTMSGQNPPYLIIKMNAPPMAEVQFMNATIESPAIVILQGDPV
jgi:hypothetical protein